MKNKRYLSPRHPSALIPPAPHAAPCSAASCRWWRPTSATGSYAASWSTSTTTRDSPRTGVRFFSCTPTPGRARSRARRFSECSGIPGTDTCCGKRTSARGPKTWGYDMSIAARFCLPVPPNPQQPSCHVSSRRLHHYIRRQRTRSTGDRSHHGMPALG